MYTIKIKTETESIIFKHEKTKTALIEYLFINYYHPCHSGERPYDEMRNRIIKDTDIIDVDRIIKKENGWLIPIRGENPRLIWVDIEEEA